MFRWYCKFLTNIYLMENPFDSSEQRLRWDQAMQEVMMERSVAQGKFEIASDMLHDIGNAIVGMGSYLTRIRRSLDQHNPDNLKNLAGFFSVQQAALVSLLGEAKAGAVVNMLNSLVEAQKVHQEEILQSVTEQIFIISHIQEILHIQRQYVNGQETCDRKPVNIRGIVNDCVSMQLASMEKRGIVITRELAEEIPVIKGDRTRLMQVILNVLKNSIEAIDLKAAEKKIGIRVMAADGVLSVQLKDNGCGFDEATGKQLFERGFTTKSSGTGLGLHNCRSIVESHDGTITIDSEGPGKGSVTTITFKSQS
jgi:signal transduction histidine kinase